MKTSSVVLLLSSLVNVGILSAFAMRPALAPAAFRDMFQGGAREPLAAVAPKAAVRPASKRPLWAELSTSDLPTLIARLRAAGVPPDVIREIIRAEVNSRYEARIRAYTEPDASTPYWKAGVGRLSTFAPARYEEYQMLVRERSRILRELLGDPALGSAEITAAQRRQFGDLPKQKIDALQRIEDDYAEMNSAVRSASNGILLPEDRAKLALLAKEKEADLARVLTPEELADYQVRSSPITRLLSQYLGEFHPSEAEFRALYDVQRVMNEKNPNGMMGGGPSASYAERQAAQQESEAQLRAKLGDTRYNDYVRETSDDYQRLRRLAEQENLAPQSAVRAYELRNTISTESIRIMDSPMTDDQKRTALAALGQSAREQINIILGPVAGASYIKTLENSWLRHLSNGSAFNFTGGPNMTIGSDNVMVSFGSSAMPIRTLPRPNQPPRP